MRSNHHICCNADKSKQIGCTGCSCSSIASALFGFDARLVDKSQLNDAIEHCEQLEARIRPEVDGELFESDILCHELNAIIDKLKSLKLQEPALPRSSDGLLPCPFCGGELHFNEEFPEDVWGDNQECLCYQGFGFLGNRSCSKDELIAAVNRREPIPKIL